MIPNKDNHQLMKKAYEKMLSLNMEIKRTAKQLKTFKKGKIRMKENNDTKKELIITTGNEMQRQENNNKEIRNMKTKEKKQQCVAKTIITKKQILEDIQKLYKPDIAIGKKELERKYTSKMENRWRIIVWVRN